MIQAREHASATFRAQDRPVVARLQQLVENDVPSKHVPAAKTIVDVDTGLTLTKKKKKGNK